MSKDSKLVNVAKEDKSSKGFGVDESGKIVKIKDKGNNPKRATTHRVLAIVLWVLAIAFEILAIFRFTGRIEWFPGIKAMTFVIACIVLDLACFVPASLLWKKANHIDPASEKNKLKFWINNNLGSILSLIAFLPIIVVVLTDKNADKKSKTIVTVIAAVALIIAGVTGYDFHPVSQEMLSRAEQEVSAVSTDGYVYWAKYSKKYHVDKNCPAFSHSDTVYQGTVKQAYEKNLTDPCRRCIPEIKDSDAE